VSDYLLSAFRLLGVIALGTLIVCALILSAGAIYYFVLCALSGAGESGNAEADADEASDPSLQ